MELCNEIYAIEAIETRTADGNGCFLFLWPAEGSSEMASGVSANRHSLQDTKFFHSVVSLNGIHGFEVVCHLLRDYRRLLVRCSGVLCKPAVLERRVKRNPLRVRWRRGLLQIRFGAMHGATAMRLPSR